MGHDNHPLPKRPVARHSDFPKLCANPPSSKKVKAWAATVLKSSPGTSSPDSSKDSVRDAHDFPALDVPPKPAILHANLVADDGTTFLLPAQALAKASDAFKSALTIPTPSPHDEQLVPEFPITGVSTAAVEFLAGVLTCPDAYHHPPHLALNGTEADNDALLTDLVELQDKFDVNPQIFFQAVIRRLELDYGHAKSQTIFVFATLGKFITVVARYSTFLLSPVHQYQYIYQPKRFWWTRTLMTKAPDRFEEVGIMVGRWNSEMTEFVGSCLYTDFKFSDTCSTHHCPTYASECGLEAAYYIHAAICIWETIEAYPQCVCLEVLLVALESEFRDSFCKTCGTAMIEAILRQYDWNITPSSWRLGNLNRDMPDMLFDYMSWTLSGKMKAVTTP
ncbi:hypothetical protein CcaverHIS002_0110080 [Cutaneotrichosporon cavernicola]|uniref:Uncharacterized protein n=1 Tax=Cutaneotrichosporon cavernicola TaxID=279322 RepID=A0AA48HZ94_9TREE|nr:uncharacterized protein CcaverHIS019_0110020 [Cutaneotrichosporon cavernicola]BEI80479.1 hypothetical protein CcaverHIS002_0110080 [Cutaneotrichosporon cavernicola]BEI88284.1 hypothetical protein CcaverHIS019_0110020 [Cutaneotrichosporon cavernicola]BEI96056.1 hypothetical protein CcaverHIS631_0110050 [Cutaneotrichosporon cavernicola]BEJ03828.1 hypothetical protein CcaverHIS641_0110030 [Cutaneotrichosporon cavernicola]